MTKNEILRLSATEIAQMFTDYVERMQDQERHTQAACKEVDAFDTCCESEFPRNVRLQNLMYEKMMNAAVEFEESGFIAGFQTAVSLIFEQEAVLPAEPQNTPKSLENSKQVTITRPQEQINTKFISTRSIANLFGTSNWKVVNRIEKHILPECSEQEQGGFVRCFEKNEQRRNTDVYRLDHQACKIFINYMSRHKKFLNVSGGIGQMEELINNVFFEREGNAVPA